MSATFVDYQAGYARQHADSLDPAKDAQLFTAPEPRDDSPARLQKLRRQISAVQSATCNGLAAIGLPLKFRPLVCAVLAASNGETHFKASYKVLVNLLFQQGDGRTFNARKCEVRKLLKALRAWQEETKITLCTIRPGGRTKDEQGKDEYHDTEFELVFLDAIAKAMVRNPEPDQMRAAVRVEIAAMMKLPPFDSRWQVKPPTLEQMQQRDKKAAVTKAVKAAAAELDVPAGGDPFAYLDQLHAEAKRQLEIELERRANGGPTSSRNEVEETPSVASEDFEEAGVCLIRHTPRPLKTVPQERRYKVLNLDAPPPPESESSPEGQAAWDGLCERLRAQPVEVTTVEIEAAASDNLAGELTIATQTLPSSHTCPSPPVEPEQLDERIFIMCEGGDVSEAEAAEIARRDLCEACRVRVPESDHFEVRQRCPT
jgi:hypothetical protein